VILGAGASIAACPNGDKNGIKLPSMQDFIKILDFEDSINPLKSNFKLMNFEDFYNLLTEKGEYQKIREELERRVYDYFRKIKIPKQPTIYDYLFLSLRKKDIVATFNWDPLIVQAYYRNKNYFELPEVIIVFSLIFQPISLFFIIHNQTQFRIVFQTLLLKMRQSLYSVFG